MKFGDMRDRIVILSPGYSYINDLGETVPAWAPFHPYTENNPLALPLLTVLEGEPFPKYSPGTRKGDLLKFAVWASVKPMNGREYEEAQKLRAETTYNIRLRYAPGIRSDFKILFCGRLLNIESVLNLDSRNREIRIVASEVDTYGKEE